MRPIIYTVLCALVFACGDQDDEQLRSYYRSQVNDRLLSLRPDTTIDHAALLAVHNRIENIILVSKDAENPVAAVAMADRLFDSISSEYSLPRGDFGDISAGMALMETELMLRENELAFFNRVAMDTSGKSGKLFTAH